MKLKIYMAYAGDPFEGAMLVFAHTAREARKLVFPELLSWCPDIEWTDMRLKRLRDSEHLYDEADYIKLCDGIPHVIVSPTSCKSCCQWGDVIGDDGLCETCREERV